MAFRIGGKVVCIDDSPTAQQRSYSPRLGKTFRLIGDLDGLTRGQVYTVRGIDADWADGHPVLFLEEIVRPPLEDEPAESGFDQRRFRPLIERKKETDISIFKKLLTPQKVDA